MKVHLFKVNKKDNDSIIERIRHIGEKDYDKRTITLEGDKLRLEHIELSSDEKLLFCDFTKIRDEHGPAKVIKNSEAIGFDDLGPEDGFGEFTAVLFDLERDYVVVQYNHFGPRVKSISDYIGHYGVLPSFDGFHFAPKLDPDIDKKIKKDTLVKKIELSVAASHLTDEDYADVPLLAGAKAYADNNNIETINISITAKRTKESFLPTSLVNFANWVGSRKEIVKNAEVKVAQHIGDKNELLDLLCHRLTIDYEITPDASKLYPRTDRYEKLRQAHSAWLKFMHK